MRSFVLSTVGFLLFGAAVATAQGEKPNFTGTWTLDPARSELDQTDKALVLLIEQKGATVHVQETRGGGQKDDITSFRCGTLGKQCSMKDGGTKAEVSVYYNGPVLVVIKTHGRKGSVVEKRRLLLSPSGDTLTVEVMHIEPDGNGEKLVLSKTK